MHSIHVSSLAEAQSHFRRIFFISVGNKFWVHLCLSQILSLKGSIDIFLSVSNQPQKSKAVIGMHLFGSSNGSKKLGNLRQLLDRGLSGKSQGSKMRL